MHTTLYTLINHVWKQTQLKCPDYFESVLECLELVPEYVPGKLYGGLFPEYDGVAPE